ncbi:MAG TPA: dienelactone hydrolase family protein [Acidimicrobiales bacterium]|jgi:carboxymethylenebutenolidase|nr:dienelactone hydrolase family protein [Acidimicrobiales bacterium]
MYDGIMAETIKIAGHGGDEIGAYFARPLGPGPYPGVAVIHHMPGWDEATKEIARRFATHGYSAICPNLFYREGPDASPDDAAAASRAAGGAPDERVVGDVDGSRRFLLSLVNANGKVGVIGYCSGGRQTYLSACRLPFDAAVDCYGAFVVGSSPEGFPVKMEAVVGLTGDLSCPLLGLFGADDQAPSPEHVAEIEAALKDHGKTYEFHSYEGAGHGFFATDRTMYRPEAATDGWQRIWTWFDRYLAS